MSASVVAAWLERERDPYLSGLHAPVATEVQRCDLRVHGTIPSELDGTFLQIGSNPRYAPVGAYHVFDGDGMVHAVRLRDGRASYRNRWVRTRGFEREARAGRALSRGILEPITHADLAEPFKETANTDLIVHRGRLLALWWIAGPAYRLDPDDLRTLGADDFDGALPRRIAAHAKVDPRTGALVFLDWHLLPPWLCVGEIAADGRLVRYAEVALPGPRLQHDLALTPNYVVVLDAPLLLEPAAMAHGCLQLKFERNGPLRLGLVPRTCAGPVRWFDAEASYVFHLVNAWEEDGRVIVDGCRIAEPLIEDGRDTDARVPRIGRIRIAPTLHRWRLDLHDGSLSESTLDDRWTEFPRTDDRMLGEEVPFTIHPTIARRETLLFDGLMRRDGPTGRIAHAAYPAGCYGGEASVVSGSPGSSTRFLLVYVTDEPNGRSELCIFDAEELREPVARVELPQRVPAGFHTRWVPSSGLADPRPVDLAPAAAGIA